MRASQARGRRIRQGAGRQSAVPHLQRVRPRPQRIPARDPAVLGAAWHDGRRRRQRVAPRDARPHQALRRPGRRGRASAHRPRRARSAASSDPTARARRPRSTCSPASTAPTPARSVCAASASTSCGPHQITARGVARTFQIAEALREHDRAGERPACRPWPSATAGPAGPIGRDPRRARDGCSPSSRSTVTATRSAKELSGGQSMLLQIARGLMVHPIHLFLMDEPFAGVHPTIKDTIMETILRMNRDGGRDLPHRLPRDGDLAPAVPARVGDARGQAHRRGIVRRSRQPRRWCSRPTWDG